MDLQHLTWPFFDPSHRDLAEGLRRWAEREVAHLAEQEEQDPDAVARELVERLGQAGWLRYCVPAPYGGIHPRLDVRSLCVAREVLAYHSGLADFAFAMQGLGSAPIALFGSEELRARYLPEVAGGRRIAAFALSEPQAGSDVAAIQTTARRDGGGYVLRGVKTWISNAGLAHHYVVFARTGVGREGLSAFVVDSHVPGLEVSARIRTLSPHPLGTLTLDGCWVPEAQRLGEEGQGFQIALQTLDVFRPTVGAAAVGFGRRALDEAARYTRRRVAFGQPLSDFQLVRWKLASMATELDASCLLVYRAAWAHDRDARRGSRDASMAKLFATEAAQRVVDQAVQLHGAWGVVSGSVVERLYREVRALRIYEGTSEIQALVVGREVARGREEVAR
jgi:acyl-CoA dehydrogenase